ncbi:MAG: Uma2 family endonuclease, partial [Bacteroidota bacterium]
EVEMANENNTFDGFLLKKVKKLHQFGTEKIIWIFTKSKTVIVSTVNQKWDFLDWDNEVEIMDGISFNIAAYLQEKGIDVGE